jgi:RNA-directed DNA polymerase
MRLLGFREEKKEKMIMIKTSVYRKLAHEAWEKYFSPSKLLTGIQKRSGKGMKAKFSDLYSLLKREDFIYQTIIKLKSNKGVDIDGVDGKTIDFISANDVVSLQNKLKNRKFKFNPVKRIMIPKPGKTEKGPLGISTFTDRIGHQMIRSILKTIYEHEPVFELLHANDNYGFHLGIETKDAIKL